MNLKSILLSICVAGLALGVDGENVNFIYISGAFASVVLFCVLAIMARTKAEPESRLGLTAVNALLFLYILFSSFITYLGSRDQLALISTAPLLLLPLSFAVFRGLSLSGVQWNAIDVDRVCSHAALLFCATLVAGEPSAFVSSVIGGARFTWTEFRAVNPLPVLAAMLIVWRHGFRAIWRLDFLLLVIYIYSTKYVNWMALLLISPLLRLAASRSYGRIKLSTALLAFIFVINTVVAIYWRDAVRLVPGELARIYEIQLAYNSFVSNPLFGAGFGESFSNIVFDTKYSMHNLLAYTLSFGGLIGAVILTSLLVLYSRLSPGKSEYLTSVYLILTFTAASFKLPAIQLYMGLAFAAMSGYAAANSREQPPSHNRR